MAPAGFTVVGIIRIELETGAADRDHIGRKRRVFGIVRAKVARAGDEGDPLMAGGRGEIAVVHGFVGGQDGPAFGETPAHGNDRNTRLVRGRDHAVHQIAEGLAVGLDQNDPGAGGDGMHPLDIEG